MVYERFGGKDIRATCIRVIRASKIDITKREHRYLILHQQRGFDLGYLGMAHSWDPGVRRGRNQKKRGGCGTKLRYRIKHFREDAKAGRNSLRGGDGPWDGVLARNGAGVIT